MHLTDRTLLRVILVAVAGVMSATVDATCPWACRCADSDLIVNCTAQQFSYVPYFTIEKRATRLLLALNNITSLDYNSFSRFTALKDLDLSNNAISSVTSTAFSNLRYLQWLDLQGNRISAVPFTAFRRLFSLTYLNLSTNSLQSLPDLSRCSHLETLSLRDNLFPSTSALYSRVTGLSRLQNLDLSENNFPNLPSSMLRNLPALTFLGLSRSNIKVINARAFSGLGSLKVIDISDNVLQTLNSSPFKNNKRLKVIQLYGNDFTCSCSLKDFVEWLKIKVITTPGGAACSRAIDYTRLNRNDCYGYFTTTTTSTSTISTTVMASTTTQMPTLGGGNDTKICRNIGLFFAKNVTFSNNNSASIRWNFIGVEPTLSLTIQNRELGRQNSVKSFVVSLGQRTATLHSLDTGKDYVACGTIHKNTCFKHACVDFKVPSPDVDMGATKDDGGNSNTPLAVALVIVLAMLIVGTACALFIIIRRKQYTCHSVMKRLKFLSKGDDDGERESTPVRHSDVPRRQSSDWPDSNGVYESITYESVTPTNPAPVNNALYRERQGGVPTEPGAEGGYTVPDAQTVDPEPNIYTPLSFSPLPLVSTNIVPVQPDLKSEPHYVNAL